jgi:hypothetical protein
MSTCCGAAARPTLSDYIDRGMRRRRAASLPIAGAVLHDCEGRFARFTLRVEDGVLADVAFTSSACVTLVAYCELASERVTCWSRATRSASASTPCLSARAFC